MRGWPKGLPGTKQKNQPWGWFFCGRLAPGDVDAKPFEQVVPNGFAAKDDDAIEHIEADKNGEQQFPFSGQGSTDHGCVVEDVDAVYAQDGDVKDGENEPFKQKPDCKKACHDIGHFAEACLLLPMFAAVGAAHVPAGRDACA